MKALIAGEVKFVVIPVSALATSRIAQATQESARAEIVDKLAQVNMCVGLACFRWGMEKQNNKCDLTPVQQWHDLLDEVLWQLAVRSNTRREVLAGSNAGRHGESLGQHISISVKHISAQSEGNDAESSGDPRQRSHAPGGGACTTCPRRDGH